VAHCLAIQFFRDVTHEKGVPKLPLLAFETLQPRHSTEEEIGETETFA
jgi:hypothetical protein